MAKADFSFFYPFKVRYSEIDGQKIVFNAHYLTYLDTAITEYLWALPYDYMNQVDRTGLDFHTVKTVIDYSRPIDFAAEIEVHVRIGRIGRSSMTFLAEIHPKGAEDLYASGEVVWVNADQATHKSAPLVPELIDLIRAKEGDKLEEPAKAPVAPATLPAPSTVRGITRYPSFLPRISHTVAAGDLVSLVCVAADGSIGEADQTANILSRLDDHMVAAGTSRSQLAQVTVFVQDMAQHGVVEEQLDAWLGNDPPPVTLVASALAGSARVEFVCLAARAGVPVRRGRSGDAVWAEAAGLVFVNASGGEDPTIPAQANHALAGLDAALAAAGTGGEHIVRFTTFYQDFYRLLDAWPANKAWTKGDALPASAAIGASLPNKQLIDLRAVAAMPHVTPVSRRPSKVVEGVSTFVRTGDWLHVVLVAGDGSEVIADQATNVLDRLDGILAEHGVDKTRLVQLMVYLQDLEQWPVWHAVYSGWMPPGHEPNRATVGVALANAIMIEIEVLVWLGER